VPPSASAASTTTSDPTPPSPSITSSPIASSIAPPSQISRMTPPPGSTGSFFDSRQQSPVVSSGTSASNASPRGHNTSASAVTSPQVAAYPEHQSLNGFLSTQTAASPQPPTEEQTREPSQQQPASTSLPVSGSAQSLSAPSAQQPIPTAPSPLPQQVQQIQKQPSQQQLQQYIQAQASGGSSPLPPTQPLYAQGPIGASQGKAPAASTVPQQPTPSQLPNSLSDLVASFEGAKQKAAHRMTNLDQVHKVLEAGFGGIPQPLDTEKPKYYIPRNPYVTPPYYPQSPLDILSTPALFAQLDVETLFYVFYYLPGSYQQYLAAQELKKQSWRFHVKYLTWFQRHSEPQAITDEYEQGVYVYFDWEGSWCQRKKSDFRFEYRYLSED